MAFHLLRTLIIFAILMVIIQGQDQPPAGLEEEKNSSSEEIVVGDATKGSRKRNRRNAEDSLEAANVGESQPKAGLPAIPGLPDPETIMKIAEILTTVGQQVLPIFVSGNSAVPDLVSSRVSHDMKFLKKIKNEIDVLSGELKKNK